MHGFGSTRVLVYEEDYEDAVLILSNVCDHDWKLIIDRKIKNDGENIVQSFEGIMFDLGTSGELDEMWLFIKTMDSIGDYAKNINKDLLYSNAYGNLYLVKQ